MGNVSNPQLQIGHILTEIGGKTSATQYSILWALKKNSTIQFQVASYPNFMKPIEHIEYPI